MEPSNATRDSTAEVRARDELIARAGHDLRTPLASILTWLRVLRGEALGPQGSQAVAMAERAARELGQIVGGLEDAQQLMAGSLEVRQLPVDLVAVVRSAVEAVLPAAEARGLPLEASVGGPSVLLRGDGDRLNHALNRLLLNAAILMAPGGRIAVSLDADASEARLRIQCVGLGLSPALRQAMVAGPEWPALGGPAGQVALDFAVACRIVALHGGCLRADALTDGQGLLISVTLPVAPDLPLAR